MGYKKSRFLQNKAQNVEETSAAPSSIQPEPALAPSTILSSQTAQRALIQRAQLDPGSLSRRDVVELQRFMGNRAVGQLIQRKKGVEERRTKQLGKHAANVAIEELSDKLKPALVSHIFDAWKSDGTEPADSAEPSGLHAYRNGNLPDKVTQVGVRGSTGQVHTLTWQWGTNTKNKQSTMFPVWLSEDKVKTLIALKYPKDGNVMETKVDLAAKGILPEKVRNSIQQGQTINIGKSGNTVYPEL